MNSQPTTPARRIIVGISGASGALYAKRVIEGLVAAGKQQRADVALHVAISDGAHLGIIARFSGESTRKVHYNSLPSSSGLSRGSDHPATNADNYGSQQILGTSPRMTARKMTPQQKSRPGLPERLS